MNSVRTILNKNLRSPFAVDRVPSAFSVETAKTVTAFHSSIPGYHPTPLHDMKSLTDQLGLARILIKDESHRFGLKAFKILGGSFAIARLICLRLGLDIEKVRFENLKSEEISKKIGILTFTTASDGNHGRGVAWAAEQLGHKAIVFLPKGTVRSRIEAISKTGAEAIVTDLNYDDTVRFAAEMAQRKGWELIQDTSWESYTEIPEWIMQGYTTIVYETLEQMKSIGIARPSHVFLQAGVGSMAGSILGYFLNLYGESYPITAVIEPEKAACHFDSVSAGDGKPHCAEGNLDTAMAGLSCGEPSLVSWKIIRNFADVMISCPDHIAVSGMRLLAKPTGEDPEIISGESGAVGAGLLHEIMRNDSCIQTRQKLRLRKDSAVLLINTEGDTDPENYRKIIGQDRFV